MARRQQPAGAADKPQTNFNGSPSNTNPYAARAQDYLNNRQKRVAGLPKAEMPVAGGAAPPIPALHGAIDEGGPLMPMASHAELARAGREAAAGALGGAPIAAPVVTPAAPGLSNLDLRPTDVLPEAATQDPNFLQGTGAMAATSQPSLAQKYGVVRNGQFVPPQQLQLRPMGTQQQIRPETAQGLADLAAAQAGAPTREEAKAQKEEEGDPDIKERSAAEQEKELEQKLREVDDFQLQKLKDAMAQNVLNNPEQKELIESRLEPLDIGDYLNKGYVEQRIPIVPNKFELVLRSTEGDVDLAIKRIVMEKAQTLDVSDQYWLDLYSYYSAIVGLHGINSRVFPSYRNDKGEWDDKLFEAKFNQVIRLPMHVLASVGCNVFWFEARVRELCKATALGNG